MCSHRGFGGCGEDVHPRFGDGYPRFGAQNPLLAWRGTQSPTACPRRAPRDFSRSRGSFSWSREPGTCGSVGSRAILCRFGGWLGWQLGRWLCPCPRGARQSLERSPSIIPSSRALSLGRGLQLQRAPGLEAAPRSAEPAEPQCHPGSGSGDRSARTRPLPGPGLN